MQFSHWLRGAILAATVSAVLGAEAAESTSARGNVLEEIVVTAQFVTQNLQDTPIAITAMSGETLEARGHQTVEQISAQAPNVTLTRGGQYAGPALIGFIRGVGQTDFNPALEPGVGLYVDDVYYSTLTGSVLDLLDLDRLEVLRGPQGTLNGKNSIGGSIKLYTRRPDEELDAYIEASTGSYDALTLRGATNFTLVEGELYGRISGASRSRDGHVDRVDWGCSHPGAAEFSANGVGPDCKVGTEGGIDYTAARLALRWLPSELVEVNFALDRVDDDSEAPANVLLMDGPTIAPTIIGSLIWPTVAIPPTLGSNVGCMFIPYGPHSCDPQSPDDPYLNYSTYSDPRTGLVLPAEQYMESTGASLNVDWQISDTMQLQSITAYREYDAGWGNDGDGTPMPVVMLYQVLRHEQTSQELRLSGQMERFMDWTVGAFWYDAETEMDARVTLGYAGFDFIHGPDPVDSENWAVFGNAIFYLGEHFDLSVGARYSEDEKQYAFARHNPDGSAIQPCLGPPGTPGNPPNCLISSLNGITSLFEDDRVDYRIALSYRWTEDVMPYAQFSTGYKGGGVNPRPFYDVQAVTFNPEELEAIEVGLKVQLLEDRLRLNAAVFSNDYTDVQLVLNDCTSLFGEVFGRPCLASQNAGDADVEGAELEVLFLPIPELSIDASYAWLDFEFTEVNPATGLDLDKVPPYTPENTWSLGVQYDLQTAWGTVSPRVDAHYTDDLFTAPDNTDAGRIDDYTIVNARISWFSPDDQWEASIEGRNLTDELYYTSITDSTPGLAGATYASPGLDRTYMVSLKRRF